MIVGSKAGVPGDEQCLSVQSEYVVRDWIESIVLLMAGRFWGCITWNCLCGDAVAAMENAGSNGLSTNTPGHGGYLIVTKISMVRWLMGIV